MPVQLSEEVISRFRVSAAEKVAQIEEAWERISDAPDDELLHRVRRELHTLKGDAHIFGFRDASALCHKLEELIEAASRHLFQVSDEFDLMVTMAIRYVGALVLRRPGRSSGGVERFVREIDEALAAMPAGPPPASPRARPATMAPRVAAGERDRLSPETRARLSEIATEVFVEALVTGADAGSRLGRAWRALVGEIGRLRAVRLDQRLERHAQAARLLADDLGKPLEVAFDVPAEAVSARVVDAVDEAVLHAVRNAVDHGIEPAAERLAAGKGEAGTITIRADVIGTSLRVQVRDDGGGIDIDAVRKSAVERGLIEAPSARILSDDQILAYLFSSGFSTRKSVTPVSGRGVGLDVVRATTEALGGTVTTHNYPGRGTSFVLLVPVSALITGLMLVEIGDGRYALPAAEVRAVLPAADHPVVDSIDGPAIRVAGELVPLVPLPEILGEPQVTVADARLVLARSGEITMALAGTRGHRDREAVIRDPGPILEGNPYVRGGIDLEDGSVALVLELDRMVTAARGVAVSARHKGGPITSQVTAKVLVVEDSVIMRDIIAEALRAHGVEVIEAADGVEALAALELHPDLRLLVTDLEMPRMDGFELIRRMRLQPRPTRLPAVVVSTRGSDADKLAAIEVGADAYLVKADFSRESLWSHIARFLLP